MTKNFNERRLAARIKGHFQITITEMNESIEVNTIDISMTGLRFHSSKNIPLFREIVLSLALPGRSTNLVCNAIVVRSEKYHHGEGYHIALTFIDIDPEHKETLKDFLKEASKQTPIKEEE